LLLLPPPPPLFSFSFPLYFFLSFSFLPPPPLLRFSFLLLLLGDDELCPSRADGTLSYPPAPPVETVSSFECCFPYVCPEPVLAK
jgi:hypothetical protein